MRTGLALAGAVVLLCGRTVLMAQEVAPTPPPPAATQEKMPAAVIDELPTYKDVLTDQWSGHLPEDVVAAERSTENYGRLLDIEPTQPVTLPQCVALALQNNTDLRIRQLTPLNATAGVRRAWGVFDPQLYAEFVKDRLDVPATSVLTSGGTLPTPAPTNVPTPNPEIGVLQRQLTQNFRYNAGVRKELITGGTLALEWHNNRQFTNPSIAYPVVPQYTTSLGFTLNQPLLRDFGWQYALLQVQVAQNTEQVTYLQYEAALANLVTLVERNYWTLVLAIENVRVQEDGLANAKELLRQNEGKFKVGALPRTSVLEAEAEVARREANLIEFQNRERIARDNLRAVINYRPAGSDALLMLTPADKPSALPYPLSLERSLQTALQQRPELLAARLQVEGSGIQRKIAENQLLPKLNFVGAIGLNGLSGTDQNVSFLPGEGIPVNKDIQGDWGRALGLLPDGRFYNYTAGVTVEVPIDNAEAKAAYAQANVGFEQSRLSLQQVQENVTLEIRTAVSNLETDLKSMDATRVARELAEENVHNQQARYDVGLATTKDLIDFQERLTTARFREVEALTTYNINLAEMHRVEGTLLDERNIVIDRVAPEDTPWWARF